MTGMWTARVLVRGAIIVDDPTRVTNCLQRASSQGGTRAATPLLRIYDYWPCRRHLDWTT